MIAGGILFIVGGIYWTIITSLNSSFYFVVPQATVSEDFNLVITTGGITWANASYFPAVMGIIGGVSWIIFAFLLDGGIVNFFGSICSANGWMLAGIGGLNCLRGLLWNGVFTEGLRSVSDYINYPSPMLRFLFCDHPILSVFIFGAAAIVLIRIGFAST